MEGELPPGRIGPAAPIVTAAPPTAERGVRERPHGGGRQGRSPGSRRSPPLKHGMELGVSACNYRVFSPFGKLGRSCSVPQTEAGGAGPGRPLVLAWASRACSTKGEIRTHVFRTSIKMCISSTFSQTRSNSPNCFIFLFPAALPVLRREELQAQAAVPGQGAGSGQGGGARTSRQHRRIPGAGSCSSVQLLEGLSAEGLEPARAAVPLEIQPEPCKQEARKQKGREMKRSGARLFPNSQG